LGALVLDLSLLGLIGRFASGPVGSTVVLRIRRGAETFLVNVIRRHACQGSCVSLVSIDSAMFIIVFKYDVLSFCVVLQSCDILQNQL
jgi:hypothetical protein